MTNDRRRKKKIQTPKNDSRFELPWDRPVTFDTLANRANLTGVLVPRPRAASPRPTTRCCLFFFFPLCHSGVLSVMLSRDLRGAYRVSRSQASSVIRQCPVTAVSGVRTCGRRYPILNLCHSAPTDQQSNFTQVRSD